MAPEQAGRQNARPSGRAADVYALGAILYEALTGGPPFRGEGCWTPGAGASEEPVPPTRLQPGIPRDLETICLKCLQKDPARRYPSAAEKITHGFIPYDFSAIYLKPKIPENAILSFC